MGHLLISSTGGGVCSYGVFRKKREIIVDSGKYCDVKYTQSPDKMTIFPWGFSF